MKPTVKETISRTVIVDNSSETNRAFDISANVSIENERPTSIHDGRVNPHSDEANDMMMAGGQLATFHSNNPNIHLYIDFTTIENREAIFEAVESFVSDIRAHASEF